MLIIWSYCYDLKWDESQKKQAKTAQGVAASAPQPSAVEPYQAMISNQIHQLKLGKAPTFNPQRVMQFRRVPVAKALVAINAA